MIEQDILVGLVAAGLGVFVTASAIRNTEVFSRFWLSRRLETAWGSNASRGVGALVGLLLTFLGLMLVFGFLPARKSLLGTVTIGPGGSLPATACHSPLAH